MTATRTRGKPKTHFPREEEPVRRAYALADTMLASLPALKDHHRLSLRNRLFAFFYFDMAGEEVLKLEATL